MKCRNCGKSIRTRDKENYKKRLGRCNTCANNEKKWVKKALKLVDLPKAK